MEIIDYLRVARGRLWVLILIPLLAAALAAAYVLIPSTTYSAAATVSSNGLVGGPTGPFTGSQGTSQFVAAFTASATGPAVLAAAAREVQLPTNELKSGISVAEQGLSSDMTVKFTSSHRDAVVPALRAVVKATINSMFISQVRLSNQKVAYAADALARANRALVNFGNRHHMADPAALYQAQLGQLSILLQRQAALQAAGNVIGAQNMAPSIAAIRSKLAQFSAILPTYNSLKATQQATVDTLSAAQDAARTAHAQLVIAEANNGTFVGPVKQVDRKSHLVSTLLIVIGLGFFLAVLVVLILELFSNRRRPARDPHPTGVVAAEASTS
jgi:uncharacterized protein involved in exopolysaccharide biosynthesis